MKGLTGPEIIGIIIAVIAGVVILYIMWVNGWLKFLGPVSESECNTNLVKACSGEVSWDTINSKYKSCLNNFQGAEKTKLEDCLNNYQTNPSICNEFCAVLVPS